jgi:hypothetical protein
MNHTVKLVVVAALLFAFCACAAAMAAADLANSGSSMFVMGKAV